MKPACYNRAPFAPYPTRYGVDSQTGEVIAVDMPKWFDDFCATWAGRGIGPTEETTHYPQAHGFDCAGCRWLPDEPRYELTDKGKAMLEGGE